jgi:hypothetical protein
VSPVALDSKNLTRWVSWSRRFVERMGEPLWAVPYGVPLYAVARAPVTRWRHAFASER